MMDIKVALVDDHNLFRKGMRLLMNEMEDIHLIMEAADGEMFLDEWVKYKPDVVLMDIEMPNMGGLEATQRVRSQRTDLPILMLSTHQEESFILSAMKHGASGYLLKTAEEEEVELAIKSAYQTGFYFNDQVSLSLLRNLTNENYISPNFSSAVELNETEGHILKMICEEYTTKEIADQLHLGKRTIDGYSANILEKIGARNTAGLVIYAIKYGIFPLDG